jgi:hypothetical protein
MSPERTAPNELIGLEEKQRAPYQKATAPPSSKNPAGPMLILT